MGRGSSSLLSKFLVGLQWLGLQKKLPKKRSVKCAITSPSSGLSWFCLQALQFLEMRKNTCSWLKGAQPIILCVCKGQIRGFWSFTHWHPWRIISWQSRLKDLGLVFRASSQQGTVLTLHPAGFLQVTAGLCTVAFPSTFFLQRWQSLRDTGSY